MKNKILSILLLIGISTYAQENTKIDSLGNEIKVLEEKISELKGQIQSEITHNGFFLTAEKEYSFSKLFLKDKKYGETIDTIKVGDKVKVIGKDIGAYKIVYNGKIGFVDEYKLKVDDESNLQHLEYKHKHSPSSGGAYTGSSGSTYVKGHYRKTKSGKKVWVKGHYRKTKSGKKVWVKGHYRKK